MFRWVWRTLKWGVIALVLFAIAAPLWEKAVASYEAFSESAKNTWYLGWAPGWLALVVAAFVAGIIADMTWWSLIFWRFRNAAEIKIFDQPGDPSKFELALIVGEWIEEYEEDGQIKVEEFHTCNQFLDLFPPKNLTRYLRKDLEGIDFVRTGRDPREHIWDVLKCRIGLVRARKTLTPRPTRGAFSWSDCRESNPAYMHPMHAYCRYTTVRCGPPRFTLVLGVKGKILLQTTDPNPRKIILTDDK